MYVGSVDWEPSNYSLVVFFHTLLKFPIVIPTYTLHNILFNYKLGLCMQWEPSKYSLVVFFHTLLKFPIVYQHIQYKTFSRWGLVSHGLPQIIHLYFVVLFKYSIVSFTCWEEAKVILSWCLPFGKLEGSYQLCSLWITVNGMRYEFQFRR